MSSNLTILVLGVGGNVSQGILKAIRVSQLACRVVGACISPVAAGLYTVDRAYISPRADEPSFVDWLVETCRREAVAGILSGVGPVLEVLSRNADLIRRETGARAVVSGPKQLAMCRDKLETNQWLLDRGLNAPRTVDAGRPDEIAGLLQDCGYPLVAKMRRGKGSQGLFLVRDSKDLAFLQGQREYLLQEYLADAANEYTASTFSDRESLVRGAVVLRRSLQHGTTIYAEAGLFPEIRAEAQRIAEALKPVGPCNMQFRVSRGRAVCFDINLRFSGTTSIRARFGFNDVEAAIRHYVLEEPSFDLPMITAGVALRYWNEIYISSEAASAMSQTSRLDSPDDFFKYVEDYGMNR